MNQIITIVAASDFRINEHAVAIERTGLCIPFETKKVLFAPRKPTVAFGGEWRPTSFFAQCTKFTLQEYSRFIIFELSNQIDTDFVLVVQWDGYAINRHLWDDNFLKYDYIGAPWPPAMTLDPGIRVGNGGFSLRSKRWLEAGKSAPSYSGEPEDVFCCQKHLAHFLRNGCRVAPFDMALRFSIEHCCPEQPEWTTENSFGFHGWFHPDRNRYRLNAPPDPPDPQQSENLTTWEGTHKANKLFQDANACYKFATIANYVNATRQYPIRRIIDVGAGTGETSLIMHNYFPLARIYGFEAVKEYCETAQARTAGVPQIRIMERAVSHQHLYRDDLGLWSRESPARLKILKAAPESAPSWQNGSIVLPEDHVFVKTRKTIPGYVVLEGEVRPITLSEIFELAGFKEVDLLKVDCEGGENSLLGCASGQSLKRIRFIVGEYHDIHRFYRIMLHRLFATHKVNLVGEGHLGYFFAEHRQGEADGVLLFDKSDMLLRRPWLCDEAIDWHVFNESYVRSADRFFHGLHVPQE